MIEAELTRVAQRLRTFVQADAELHALSGDGRSRCPCRAFDGTELAEPELRAATRRTSRSARGVPGRDAPFTTSSDSRPAP